MGGLHAVSGREGKEGKGRVGRGGQGKEIMEARWSAGVGAGAGWLAGWLVRPSLIHYSHNYM
jgi:hypothetical protein